MKKNLSIPPDNWILKQNLGQMGWRTRKNYFKVQIKSSNVKHNHSSKLESQASTSSYKDPSDEYLLSWTVIEINSYTHSYEMNEMKI